MSHSKCNRTFTGDHIYAPRKWKNITEIRCLCGAIPQDMSEAKRLIKESSEWKYGTPDTGEQTNLL